MRAVNTCRFIILFIALGAIIIFVACLVDAQQLNCATETDATRDTCTVLYGGLFASSFLLIVLALFMLATLYCRMDEPIELDEIARDPRCRSTP